MKHLAVPHISREETGQRFTMQVYLDFTNSRLRIDDYRGDTNAIRDRILELAEENRFTKVFVKAKEANWKEFLACGYVLEGIFKGYYSGSDAYSVSLYLSNERRTSDYWTEEDQTIRQLQKQSMKGRVTATLPGGYTMRIANESDTGSLAELYGLVFPVYPTPMDDPHYITKVMQEGTVFYVIEHGGRIVSAASAEVNDVYHNAEMTDCATLPEHREHGFMKVLIQALEEELRCRKIYCFYSLARALSFGMNAVFYHLGYEYTGRMIKNCNIFDKLEDMNLWVKNV